MEKSLRKVRLDVDALNAMLREKGASSLTDVDYAIFETDGRLSVIKEQEKQTVTKSDLSIQTQPSQFGQPISVISDGRIIEKNLTKLNLNQQWLQDQLQQAGVKSVDDVFYAEVQKNGELYIDKRNDLVH